MIAYRIKGAVIDDKKWGFNPKKGCSRGSEQPSV